MPKEYAGFRYDPWRQPVWGWVDVEIAGVLDLTCPHCGGQFTIDKEEWLKGRVPKEYEYQGIFAVLRACPLCTRTARIPIQLRRQRK